MAKPRSSMIKSNIYIDPKVQKGIRYLAAKRGTSYSELVRQAMRVFLIDELKKERDITEVLSEPATNS